MTKEEWYEELKMEAREDELHEKMMAKDYEYALEHSDFPDAIVLLESTLKTLSKYGWEIPMKDLLDEI